MSSANQEFVDRSTLNRVFTIDRDIGIQLHHQWNLMGMILREQGAISTGEGRNRRTASNGGICATIRGELLPFGLFEQRGDYIQADLVREKSPKVSLGYTYSFNNDAARTGGQLGEYLYAPANRFYDCPKPPCNSLNLLCTKCAEKMNDEICKHPQRKYSKAELIG